MVRFLVSTVPLMLALAACSGASDRRVSSTEVDSSKLASPRNDLPGLPNFAKVSDSLYRGAQPEPLGYRALAKLGIKTVVSLRTSPSDRAAFAGTGLKLVELPIHPSDLDEPEILAFLEVAANPSLQPLFVHCRHGADRTGTMVAAYRMVQQGWTRDEAMAELSRFGFHRIWRNLKRTLRRIDPDALREAVPNVSSPASE